jgi:hypothetical protein
MEIYMEDETCIDNSKFGNDSQNEQFLSNTP